MENIVSISDDDPNNQLAFVQQLVSQLSVAGNPVTINVVQTQQNVQGDIFYNGNSSNDNNDSSKNILTDEYFDEKVAILSEALSDLDKKVVNLSEAFTDLDKKVVDLSEALTDVKAEQTQLVKILSGITAKITAKITALAADLSPGITELLAGQARLRHTQHACTSLLTRINDEVRDGFKSFDPTLDDTDTTNDKHIAESHLP